LLATPVEAAAYPKGELRLAVCERCAFITNVEFDASRLDYRGIHEESQAFSLRFRTFALGLARSWIERYGLRDKTVLEIGSGKGDFMAMMLDEGVARGIAVDPGGRPERLTGSSAARIEWVLENFSPSLGKRSPDAIVCRHTLEHIHPVRRFLADVRAGIGARSHTVVLFEVPDTLRILRETAFWDLYYEHCSYFTPASLARLFRESGFDVIDLTLGYDGQYILLAALPRPSGQPPSASSALEEDVKVVTDAVGTFERTYFHQISSWRRRFQEEHARGRRAVVWGGGSKGMSFLTALNAPDCVRYAVDVNPNLQGRYMAGIACPVVAPAFLVEYRPDLVVVMNPVYTEEIRSTLRDLGLSPTLIALDPQEPVADSADVR
jgi:hypothetical protein